MDDRRGGGGLWAVVTAALAVCVGAAGCIGPQAVRSTRLRYNEVYRSTSDEQLLLNIVRLRYADSPVFIDLPNITSQFEASGRTNFLGGVGNQAPVRTRLGFGEMSLRDTPTLSYRPREGREIARSLLTPLTQELFSVVNAGANTEQLLLLTLNDINDVPNAVRATSLTPRVPDDNAAFLRGVRLLASLQERHGIEIVYGTTEESEESSDPIPTGQLRGGDLLDAAKGGYVYRAKSEGAMTLLKLEKALALRIRPEFARSPEMEEVSRIFRLTPGLDRYWLKSELTEESSLRSPAALGGDSIYLNMRSILQVMIFLSKGVCVPAAHVAEGVVPVTPGPGGLPFDWTPVTGGNFSVHAQAKKPRDAEVAVWYRGYWFFIDRCDVNSRAVLAILETLFSLQEADVKTVGPLLTLPVSG